MEKKPRIDLEGRTRLETVIPLSTPYLVFLDPSDRCNLKCPMCPSGDRKLLKKVGRKPQLMDYLLYKKIIDDLEDMPDPIKTLRLYKDGEPLLNPDLPKMIRYASQTAIGSIDTTTNGTLLTPKLGKKLVDAGLDKIFISVPEDYSREYCDQINNFIAHKGDCQVYVKTIGDNLWDMEREMFYVDFGDADRCFIENRINCWPGFDAGPDPGVGIYGNPLTDVRVCPYIFYSTAINSDGTVSLCFLDWKHHVIIGDLNDQSFSEIWNGFTLRKYRQWHLKGERTTMDWPCNNCKQLTHGAPDNIDAYAEELLRKI